jgi:hypothetical protein
MKIKIVLWILISMFLLGSCEIKPHNSSGSNDSDDSIEEDVSVEAEVPIARGQGGFAGDAEELTEEEKNTILAFMNAYFESLATTEVMDTASLYKDSEGINAELNRAAWEFMVEVRNKQVNDLTLQEYEYFLRVDNVEDLEEGTRITISEDSITNFSEYPDVDAEQYDIIHYFVLDETADGIKILSHLQRGTLYWALIGENREYIKTDESIDIDENAEADMTIETDNVPVLTDAQVIEYIHAQKDELFRKADSNLQLRNQVIDEDKEFVYDHPYNRDEAIRYANNWINRRNTEWLDYSNLGGNCQNFASQSMVAGGIPMDTQGDHVWKWFDATLNNTTATQGRTSSWTGVDEFYAYAQLNDGFGLVADADANFDQGEIGDIIILGFDENWRHTVMITEVLYDADGNVIEYLVASNTKDQKNYPISAYLYTRQQLIKIYGWNE